MFRGTGGRDRKRFGSNGGGTSASARLPNWSIALGKVRAGTGDAKIVFFGDSTFFGRGSNGSGTGDLILHSLPTVFSSKIATLDSINAFADGWFGNGGSPNTFALNDPRVSFGSGWASGGSTTLGGSTINNSTTTNALTFAPADPVDTFIIYNTRFSGNGTISFDVNGGTATTVDQNGSTACIATVITATLGVNTLNIKRVSGAVGIQGVEAYNSTIKQVRTINGGWSGGKSSDFVVTTQPWSPANTALWTAIRPDLVIVEAGINEWNFGGVTTTQYKTNLQTIVTNIKAIGNVDVALFTPTPSDVAYQGASTATQLGYVTKMREVAAENNLQLFDNFAYFVDYTTSNALGRYWDGAHPSQKGYSDQADFILNILKNAPAPPTPPASFLLLADGTSKLMLSDGTSKITIN